eukprot:5455307-Pyramimonas_sp.AAC.1
MHPLTRHSWFTGIAAATRMFFIAAATRSCTFTSCQEGVGRGSRGGRMFFIAAATRSSTFTSQSQSQSQSCTFTCHIAYLSATDVSRPKGRAAGESGELDTGREKGKGNSGYYKRLL